jgi:hypothetical protein
VGDPGESLECFSKTPRMTSTPDTLVRAERARLACWRALTRRGVWLRPPGFAARRGHAPSSGTGARWPGRVRPCGVAGWEARARCWRCVSQVLGRQEGDTPASDRGCGGNLPTGDLSVATREARQGQRSSSRCPLGPHLAAMPERPRPRPQRRRGQAACGTLAESSRSSPLSAVKIAQAARER